MISPDHPDIPRRYEALYQRVRAQGVEQWLKENLEGPSLEGLIYLCKFAFFTALITKAEIGSILELDAGERRQLVKSWYDDHREKGCGTC
ncbi:hypothetical protein AAU61_10725 [Desulfocarbo indianensis]|nr:hypothetical protein AAU61_10725 [Desulfocarbo indianensis]